MSKDSPDPFTEDLAADEWDEDAGPSLTARIVAEFFGTFILVLLGVGVALTLNIGSNGSLTVGLAFGVTVLAVIVAVGRISGAHINPAITVAAWLAGRFPAKDIAPYILAQVLGAVAGGATLTLLLASHPQIDSAREIMSTASIGYGDHSPAGFALAAGLIVEFIATGLLAAIVLSATSKKSLTAYAPFAIGLGLAILVVWAIPFTNGALNPARATATAIFADPWAVQQLWAWWLAPVLGAAVVGLLYRAFGPEEDVVSLSGGAMSVSPEES